MAGSATTSAIALEQRATKVMIIFISRYTTWTVVLKGN